jgi:hypothetical protein
MLKCVTITGADDATPLETLVELNAEFPFVEWGILVSMRLGSSRFPSRTWMDRFAEMAVNEPSFAVSMHVCGEWVRRLLRGKMDWGEFPNVRIVADRVQINTHAQEHVSTSMALDWMEAQPGKQFIIQLDGVNDHLLDACQQRQINVAGLFDRSHGAGVLPDNWPTPRFPNNICGYAGGLSPDNVAEQVEKFQAIRSGWPFWIDMEGRVRDEDDHLDLTKVRRVLEVCAPLVAKEA